MKQLFKSTLLAAAVAATCGTAVAGTVAVTKQIHSVEGLLGVETAHNQMTLPILWVRRLRKVIKSLLLSLLIH